MQISSTNSPNFNANIKFVDSAKFAQCGIENYFYCANPFAQLSDSMVIGDKFWTSEVKSCTAGGVVGKEEALGFHLYDCWSNIRKVANSFKKIIKDNVKEPVSAIILGAKDIPTAPESVPLYNEVAHQTRKLVTPSEFKVYAKKYAEADIGYVKESDTWFINATTPKNPMMPKERVEIESVEDLKSMFESIKIAPQDKLFIGDKEVLFDEYPELFIY